MNLGQRPSRQISLDLLPRFKTDPVTRECLALGYHAKNLTVKTQPKTFPYYPFTIKLTKDP
jgi:hypothetical protein